MPSDPTELARSLTIGQRNRLVKLAKAGGSLPWGQSDAALMTKRLVMKFTGPIDGDFANITGYGTAVAQVIAGRR